MPNISTTFWRPWLFEATCSSLFFLAGLVPFIATFSAVSKSVFINVSVFFRELMAALTVRHCPSRRMRNGESLKNICVSYSAFAVNRVRYWFQVLRVYAMTYSAFVIEFFARRDGADEVSERKDMAGCADARPIFLNDEACVAVFVPGARPKPASSLPINTDMFQKSFNRGFVGELIRTLHDASPVEALMLTPATDQVSAFGLQSLAGAERNIA